MSLLDLRQFYIDGAWVAPQVARDFVVINPATEQQVATISLGSQADVDRAVAAARGAFESFGYTSRAERLRLLERLLEVYMDRYQDMAQAISQEMGAPIDFASSSQAACGNGHLQAAIDVLREYVFSRELDGSTVLREPIGVCGFITPWNWPINQIGCKVAPALATGCTMVLKPSEIAPLSSHLFAEMIHEAGYPAGVFNLVDGDGLGVGSALSAHPDIDMVSFTGSTRAGIAVAKAAADTVKRVAQELGGKSPNIILDHADFAKAISRGVQHCFRNSGQSCNAPTRMLVPASRYAEAVAIAKTAAEKTNVGDPTTSGNHIGPVVSKTHFNRIQTLIQKGIDEGAEVVIGGVGKPAGFEVGYYVKPTIFANVNNNMTIAREEVFGPVLVMIPFQDEADAIRLANDTPYGLAAYISGDQAALQRIVPRLRAGMIGVNGRSQGFACAFGGYKQSGNGREWGEFGFEDFLETKIVTGL